MPVKDTALWEAEGKAHPAGFNLFERATTPRGFTDYERIKVATAPDGVHSGDIGTWEHKHSLGTQLDPNKNGRKW